DGYHSCLVEGTYVECRSHMRQMMLDCVELPASYLTRKGLLQKTPNVRARTTITEPVQHQIDGRPLRQKIYNLAHELRTIILIEGDMVHIGELHACLTQAISSSLRRKSCPMLDAAEPFLLGSRDKSAVAQKRSGGIGVKGVETKDDHVNRSNSVIG